MADIDVKLTADKLGKSLENLSSVVEVQLHQAVKNLANAAYSSMVAQVQATEMSPQNRQDYLRGLDFLDIGDNNYLIVLNGEWANKLEDGFPSYSIKEQLLRSEKRVAVGSRSGEPWVRTSKDGKKYAAVPFEHKPYSAKAGDLASEIKNMKAYNRQGKLQKLTKTFKDDFGKPISGLVARAVTTDKTPDNLKGLVKFQQVSKKAVSGIYMTFRIVHEDSNGWIHSGFSGYDFFSKAEIEIQKELENIINTLL